MIPELAITEWRSVVPWIDVKQVEQDLIICKAIVISQLTNHAPIRFFKEYGVYRKDTLN